MATSGPKVEVFMVTKVIYTRHRKLDRPDTLLVTYYCGLRRFKEWVCLEHGRLAGKKARDWWRERNTLPTEPPETTDAALGLINTLLTPTHIRVWLNKKYPEIMAYSFDGEFK